MVRGLRNDLDLLTHFDIADSNADCFRGRRNTAPICGASSVFEPIGAFKAPGLTSAFSRALSACRLEAAKVMASGPVERDLGAAHERHHPNCRSN